MLQSHPADQSSSLLIQCMNLTALSEGHNESTKVPHSVNISFVCWFSTFGISPWCWHILPTRIEIFNMYNVNTDHPNLLLLSKNFKHPIHFPITGESYTPGFHVFCKNQKHDSTWSTWVRDGCHISKLLHHQEPNYATIDADKSIDL